MAVKTPEEEKKLLENQTVQPRNTGYQSKWQDSINSYVNQIQNRKPFQYNVNEDALYQQYANQYAQQGRMAMMDTIGQATALTGGYDNSYANSVGQQAYQGYLGQMNDVVPQLYSMALDQYINEGDQMRNQLNLMIQRDELDYGRYKDQMAEQDDAYNKLVALMTSYGYQPTEEEMAEAGMTEAHMNAITGKNKKKSSGGSRPIEDGVDPDDVTEDYKVVNQTNDSGVRVGNGGMSWGELEQAVKNGTVIEIVDDEKKTIQYIRADDKSLAGR